MSVADSLSASEQRAFELIAASDGLLQSQLWKTLDMTSRQGSRLAMTLEDKGLIERTVTTSNGQRTYLLTPIDGAGEMESTPASSSGSSPQQPPPEATLSDRQERALDLIKDRGGLYQSQLWKELDVSSRTGSRIATGLEEEDAIRRVETTHNGQRTYFLYPTKQELDFSLLMAGDMISPFVALGDGELAVDSDEFTHWLFELAREEQ